MALSANAATIKPDDVQVPSSSDAPAPVKVIRADDLRQVGDRLTSMFTTYKNDRRIAELRWLRNQRQYLGLYDPDIDKDMSLARSKAYPRVTRIKCVSVLSRLMNLMFQGEDRNWVIKASPSPDLTQADAEQAIADAMEEAKEDGEPPEIDDDFVDAAIQKMADKRATQLMTLIDDQLQEIGGDQTQDYVSLNRSVVRSGIQYGLGVLRGPFAIPSKKVTVKVDPATKTPTVSTKTVYKPMMEFTTVWDYYPDMAAKVLRNGDGYFIRKVMSRSQVYALSKRPDFLAEQIKTYLNDHPVGNYKEVEFEMELRTMGVKVNVNEQKMDGNKYEVICWHGALSGSYLSMCGVDVPDDKMADEIDAEIWMIAGNIIKADINPWAKMDVEVQTIHPFLFDEDDTSPVGQGLPNIMRDSQMAISASTRMMLDNASVVCGPQLELNTDLLRLDQDLTSTTAYKIWYRTGTGQEAQFPAVRDIKIESHLTELQSVVDMFMKFADNETFVGAATGGDMDNASEPMRTAAGASMLRGQEALPFKDIVRNFDRFTESVIQSLVIFNRKFNPDEPGVADFNVIARGATSLVAKEVRGMQVDQLAQTLQPEERDHVDMRKLVTARMATRDLLDMLLPEDVVERNQAQKAQVAQTQQQLADELQKANARKLLADAFKNIAQGNKNSAMADAASVKSALDLLEQGITDVGAAQSGIQGSANGPADEGNNAGAGLPGAPPAAGADGPQAGPDQGLAGQVPPGGLPQAAGGGAGLQ